jgi:hypothetical protein
MEIKDETDNEFIHKIKEKFPLFNVKTFFANFNGIIGQLYTDSIEYSFEHDFEKCETDEEFHKIWKKIDYVKESIKNDLLDFSKLHLNKIFGYIELECHGGTCESEGFVVKNGKSIYNQEWEDEGHINILKKINSKYEGFFFEPFTRNFLDKNIGK